MWEEMRLSLAQMRLSPERVEREAARVATPPAELPENTEKPVRGGVGAVSHFRRAARIY